MALTPTGGGQEDLAMEMGPGKLGRVNLRGGISESLQEQTPQDENSLLSCLH